MPQSRLLQLVEQQTDAPPLSDAPRGKLLYVEDIVELLGAKKSAWWVRHRFAPQFKRKVGNQCAWWERDALAWIDNPKTQAA